MDQPPRFMRLDVVPSPKCVPTVLVLVAQRSFHFVARSSLHNAVLMAEVVAHYFPKYVELHNYSAANSLRQKLYNWSTLNREYLHQPPSPLGPACQSFLDYFGALLQRKSSSGLTVSK
jgi:CH-like domain in sperm protein